MEAGMNRKTEKEPGTLTGSLTWDVVGLLLGIMVASWAISGHPLTFAMAFGKIMIPG